MSGPALAERLVASGGRRSEVLYIIGLRRGSDRARTARSPPAVRCWRSPSPPSSSPSRVRQAPAESGEPRCSTCRPPRRPGALDLTGDAARRRRVLQRARGGGARARRLRGAAPAHVRVRGRVSPRRRRRGRGAAASLPRPGRPDSRSALRFHLQHRAHRLHHVRRRAASAPSQLFRQGLPAGARARRTSARDAPGRRRAAGRRLARGGRRGGAAHPGADPLGGAGGLSGQSGPRRGSGARPGRAGGAAPGPGAPVDRPKGSRRD